MEISDLKMILACLRGLSRNLDEQKEKAQGDPNDQRVIDAKAVISDYAFNLPEEVKNHFRNALDTPGDVMSMHYASGDIPVCIETLENWIKELEDKE